MNVYLVLDMLQALLQKVDSLESNMNKLMTCVMTIQHPAGQDADLGLQTAKSLHELEELEQRLKDVHFRQRVVRTVFTVLCILLCMVHLNTNITNVSLMGLSLC